MDLSFSIDVTEHEDKFDEEYILIHIGESIILKFRTYDDLVTFSNKISGMLPEIKENLS